MMSLTFGLFSQVSGSGPLGPLVLKTVSCDLNSLSIRAVVQENTLPKCKKGRNINMLVDIQ